MPGGAAGGDQLARYAVTTRSHLRSARFFMPVLRANREIERQLSCTPGCVRFASVVAGPREFWSLSVWRSREAMQDFMRSGSHELFMWNITRWFDSFWLMRWLPSPDEAGTWSGARLAGPSTTEPTAGDGHRARTAFADIPELRAAVGPDGRPSFVSSPLVRRSRERVAGYAAVTLKLDAPRPWHVPRSWRSVRALGREVARDPDVIRSTFGWAGAGELFGLVVVRGEEAWRRVRLSSPLEGLLQRRDRDPWVMRWVADHEFGQWDGVRLRRLRGNQLI